MNSKSPFSRRRFVAAACPAGSWRAAGMAPSGFVRRHGFRALRRGSRARRAGSQALRRRLIAAGSTELAGRPDAGETLAVAVKAYESLQDLTGRIMAYASLLYASDTSNPSNREILWRRAGARDRARRRPPVFRARTQSPRRCEAERRDGGAGAWPLSPLARGHPQGEAASACRRPRTIVPRQIGQRRRRVEPAVRRHDGGAQVRFRRREPDA